MTITVSCSQRRRGWSRQLQFSDKRRFNSALKSFSTWGFSATNIARLDGNFQTRRNFSDNFPTAQNWGPTDFSLTPATTTLTTFITITSYDRSRADLCSCSSKGCQSMCLSICPIQAHNSKTKGVENRNCSECFPGQDNRRANFRLKG